MMSDKFTPDELLLLKKEIDAFLEAVDNRECAYCKGDADSQNCRDCVEVAAVKLKKRLRGVVIDCDLYGEILKEFTDSCKQNGLVLTIA